MEMEKNVVVLLVALAAAVLVFMLLPSTNFAPYTKNKGYSNFEPFSGSGTKGNNSGSPSSVLVGSVSSSSSVDLLSDFSSSTKNLAKTALSLDSGASGSEGFTSGSSDPEPATEHLRNLQWGSPNDPVIIDQFGQVKSNGQDGVNGCVSSGLSNSGGNLCLSPDLIKLLSTRGGNASGSN